MKKLLVPALSLLLPYSAWAQSELPDTTAAKELEGGGYRGAESGA